MTFLEAALHVLRREGKPLHYKEIADRAVAKGLLTMVGRTPAITMHTQLNAAVNKAPGNPFIRTSAGQFGLLRYPPLTPEEIQAYDAAGGNPGGGSAAVSTRGESRDEGPARVDHTSDGEGRSHRRRGRLAHGRPEGSSVGEAGALGEAGQLGGEGGEAAKAESREAILESDASAKSGGGAAPGGPVYAPDDGPDKGEGSEERGDGVEALEGADGVADGSEMDPGTGRRRRRRRRRRRGSQEPGMRTMDDVSNEGFPTAEEVPSEPPGDLAAGEQGGGTAADAETRVEGESGAEPRTDGGGAGDSDSRRIMAPIDAAIEILRSQNPGRGVHVRQIADAAVRRRLVHGEAHEAWRVIRAALAAEPRERLRAGLRPRVRAAGSGLFALARRPADSDLERAEQVFGDARRALRERSLAALEQYLAELSPGAFEAIGRVLLQREGFGPATFIKRVENTVYLEALRGRGFRPSRCLIALRAGGQAAGRRSIGELRAGVRARNLDEGLLMLAGRLSDEGVTEWKQPGSPVEVVDGPALAEVCARHGVGVHTATVTVEFVDADFFAELSDG